MPMPMPGKNEDHDKFMSRCHSEMSKEFPDSGQRYAVCQKQWDENHAQAAMMMPMPKDMEKHGEYMDRCMAMMEKDMPDMEKRKAECEAKWKEEHEGEGEHAQATLYPHVLQAVYGQPWAILPSMYSTICQLVAFRASGGRLTAEEIKERIGAARVRSGAARSGAIAILPLYGVMAQRMDLMTAMSGGTSTDRFGAVLQAAVADPSIGAIVLDIDSPGGSVYGVQELHDTVMASRGRKPIVAVANSMAASAAYWVASACDEIAITPGGSVGSIGCLAVHEDVSKAGEMAGVKTTLLTHGTNKALGNSFEALSEEARADLQKRVSEYGNMFEAAVAKGRGVSAGAVRSQFGQGLMFGADEAVKRGMADTVGTLQSVIERMAGNRTGNGARANVELAEMEALEFRPRSL